MKIPEKAKRVFEGKLFDVYQWEQELYDGSTATFEGLKRADTVQVLPVVGNELLLSYEEQPMKPRSYTFFGGQVEEGEDFLEAVKRELLEETGYTSDKWELYKVYSFSGKIEWSIYFYLAKDCQKVSEQQLDGGESIEVKSVTFDEFLEIVSSEDFWSTNIANDILRMRLAPQELELFKARLFSDTYNAK